jgi:hypothetical protein
VIIGPSDQTNDFFTQQRCFCCGENLTRDEFKVAWNGFPGDYITLHTGCAGRLALHLASDALKGDLQNTTHDFSNGRRFHRG